MNKSSLLASLIKLAKSDGHVDHHEDMLLKFFAIKMGISGEDFQKIVAQADTIQVVVPNTLDERVEHMYKMLSMMKLDLVAHEEEIKMCHDLGIKLGFCYQRCGQASGLHENTR